MARIRTVKPEFFTSEDVVALSPLARLLYVGLWCEADREGRLFWRPVSFRLRYLPTDTCDIVAVSQELIDRGLVVLYGSGLAYIPSFGKHQHINPRESASSLPAPGPFTGPTPPERPRVDDASSRVSDAYPRDSDAQGGREGKGKEGERDTPRARVTPLVARRKLYAAFEWARGCVPQDLHADLVAKLGGDPEAATQRLLTFYTEVARSWPDDAPIAGSDWDFWRSRFAETFGPPRGARSADASPGRGARDVAGPRPRTFADDAWGQVLARLETLLNRHAFLTWFRDTRLVSATTDRLKVLVTDDSTRDWIRRHYAEQLTEALARAGRAGIELVFVTEAELPQAVQA
jgi:hypothetical protein